MKIRDAHAILNGSTEVFEATSGAIQILGNDNQTLYEIALNDDGSLSVWIGAVVRHSDTVLDNVMHVIPSASNAIVVKRLPLEATR